MDIEDYRDFIIKRFLNKKAYSDIAAVQLVVRDIYEILNLENDTCIEIRFNKNDFFVSIEDNEEGY